MEAITRNLKISKRGLAENPVGHHAILNWKGRELLGEVTGAYYNEWLGGTFLKVHYFNGESWPIEPTCTAVKVLIQTFPNA